MTSSLLYKYKATNAQYAVHFDGPHISVPELREQITRDSKIVKGRDFFELEISNAQTGEVRRAAVKRLTAASLPSSSSVPPATQVYGESAFVGRNTSVLVRRVPLHRREAIKSASSSVTAIGNSPRTVRQPRLAMRHPGCGPHESANARGRRQATPTEPSLSTLWIWT